MYGRVNKNVSVTTYITLHISLHCLEHNRNSKKWKRPILESNEISCFSQVMRVEFFSGSNLLSLNSSIVSKDCGPPMQMQMNVVWQSTVTTWKEPTVSPPDYEWSAFTCWQPIKKCYLRLHLNQFGEICHLNLWRQSRPWVCILFQWVHFYCCGLNFHGETLWDWIKSWDTAQFAPTVAKTKFLGRL